MVYKKIIIIITLAIIGSIIFIYNKDKEEIVPNDTAKVVDVVSTSTKPVVTVPLDKVSTIATNLNIPWDLAFLPDESLLVTERVGNLVRIGKDGSRVSIKLPHPVPKGEGGLLGIVLHPKFNENNLLYLYMTTNESLSGTSNAVFQYSFVNNTLLNEKVIIKDIPGAIYHDGGRMEFGPDGLLYITTGDATSPAIAQDLKSLGGKILRLKDDGSIPVDNPFGTAVYSYGHRNPQGLAWDDEGRLWSTEHGRSGVTSGLDELNLIVKGKNYGWPTIEGDKVLDGMVVPTLHSGAKSTWAPASALYHDGSIFFGGLLGKALYEAVLDGDKVLELKKHFYNEYGRIRTVRLGPDGMFYMTTSNRDGRGSPTGEDDRIILVNPALLD